MCNKLDFSAGREVEERKSAFLSACNKRKVRCCSSCRAFTPINRDIEGLQIKVNPFSKSAVYTRPAAGSCICSKLVSDLLKLDILVTKASPHCLRLRRDSLSLPGTQPLCLSGPSATSSIIHAETDVHNADLFIYGRDGEIGQNRQFSPTFLQLCYVFSYGVWLQQREEDGTRCLKRRRQR